MIFSIPAVLIRLPASRSLLELLHLQMKPMPFFADAVGLRHAHVLERQDGRVAGVVAQLLQLAADVEAGRVRGHDDERHAAEAALAAGAGQQGHEVGLRAVGDPHLAAVDDVVVAIGHGAGANGGHVAAGVRFADADGADQVPGDGRGQEAAFEVVAAELGQGGGGHVGVDGDAHRHGGAVGPAQLFQQHGAVPVVHAAAAISLRVVQAQQAEVAHLLEHVTGRPDARRLPFLDVGVDLRLDKPPHHPPERLVLGREVRRTWFCLRRYYPQI
jgi:hypothetical protein